jgi:hypothetical protein
LVHHENTLLPPQSGAIPAMIGDQIVSRNKTLETQMSVMFNKDPFVIAKVIDLVMHERQMSLSAREWKHRLAGYGYAIRDTDHGQVVETLPHHVEVAVLPAPEASQHH